MNLILQYWDTEDMPEYARMSVYTLKKYAEYHGAEYQLFHGYPFKYDPRPYTQKMHFISEEYDKYEQVAIFDADMLLVPDRIDQNVFEDGHATRVGDSRLLGGVYNFNREERIKLRKAFEVHGMPDDYENFHDEDVITHLFNHTDIEFKRLDNKFNELGKDGRRCDNPVFRHYMNFRKPRIPGDFRKWYGDVEC